ncbi:MAG: Bax inhibitor-1/YccA family protein, partial [Fimbriimonadaceae bacterium]|nr:Bax inhibitor-1/YccA family protein [Fimbriimonadaceae bacterium]
MRGSNPMFRDSVLRDRVTLNPVSGMPGAMTGEEVMTVGGTIQKTALLLALLLPTAAIGVIFPSNALLIGSFVVSLILGLVTGL